MNCIIIVMKTNVHCLGVEFNRIWYLISKTECIDFSGPYKTSSVRESKDTKRTDKGGEIRPKVV